MFCVSPLFSLPVYRISAGVIDKTQKGARITKSSMIKEKCGKLSPRLLLLPLCLRSRRLDNPMLRGLYQRKPPGLGPLPSLFICFTFNRIYRQHVVTLAGSYHSIIAASVSVVCQYYPIPLRRNWHLL